MIHNKQIILSKKPYFIDEDWQIIQMNNGYILSYQKNTHIVTNSDNSVLLIGDAWSVDNNIESPKTFVQKLPSFDSKLLANIDNEECAWNGRYLLITGDYISLDAVGAYGVYYSEDSISSSMPLICQIENREAVYPDIRWGEFPDFVPGPYTQIEGVKRLMPSQRCNYVKHEFSYRKFLVPLQNNLDENILLEKLSQMFETSLKNMYEQMGRKPIWLALTGGKDSRTALAFLQRCKLPFNTFTFTFSEHSKVDNKLAKFCAFVFLKKHHTISKDETKFSEKLYNEYKAHTMLMNVDGESVQIPYGMYEALQSYANGEFLILRNNAWETIMDYYRSFFEFADEIISLLRANGKNDKSIDAWLTWVANDPLNKDISLWDRIFWEQREGSWLSCIEQSLELIGPMTSVQMCNSRIILSYLHAFSYEDRRGKRMQEQLVYLQEPKLSRIPYDGELHKNERVFRAFIRKNHTQLWATLKRLKQF